MNIIVGKNEKIKTISEAITLAKDEFTIIRIKNGVYEEKITINKPNIKLIGEEKDKTIITYRDYAKKLDENSQTYETFRTATVLILSENVTFENLTIKNDSGFGNNVGQAVSLFVNADLFYCKDCCITGSQDTLLTGPIPIDAKNQEYLDFDINHNANYRQVYENCFIQGDVDFIFGSANAFFFKCQLFSNNLKNHFGYISAPSTLQGNLGHIFIECELLSDSIDKTVYLARPWRSYAYCAYINCFMDAHINSEGYTRWGNTDKHLFSSFYEFENYGPGSIREKETLSKTLKHTEVNYLLDLFRNLKALLRW